MFKRILFLLILLALAPAMWAQSTTVSGQVTDAGGQAWLNGTVTAQFVQNPLFVPQPQYVWAGGALNITISGTLSGTGSYSISVPSSTAISPQGSSWRFQFCPAASSICFVTPNATVTGATLTINATPPAIVVNPGPGASAYADSEISGAVVGSTYYNTTSFTLRICNGPAPCTWASISGGGGGTIGGTVTSPSLIFASATNTIGNVAGSAVTSATGAITLTAGADTTTPEKIVPNSSTQSTPLAFFGSADSLFTSFTQTNFLPAGQLGTQQINLLNTSTSAQPGNTVVQNVLFENHGPNGKLDFGTQSTAVEYQTADQAGSGAIGALGAVYVEGTGGIGAANSGAIGVQGDVVQDSTGNSGALIGVQSNMDLNAGSATSMTGFDFFPGVSNAGTSLTNLYGLVVRTPQGAIVPTNSYGVYVFPQRGATKWAFYAQTDPSFFGGGATATSLVDSGIATGTQCVHANSAGLFSGTGADCVANPLTTLGDEIYGGASGVLTRLAGPTAPGTYTVTEKPSSGAATAETFSLPGVVPNAQTGTTYTYLATDTTNDRAGYTSFSNAGAIAATLPQAGSTGFGSNWVNVSCDIGAGTVTITPTTSTISYSTGTAYTAAASSLALTTGQCAWIYSDNTNYFAIVRTGGAGTVTSVATSSPITGGTITGAGTIACATCTTNAAALTNNVLVKGAGGQATQTSSVTDNGTTVTTTDTGGVVAPVFTANGSTAGFMDFPQGSTSAAVAPCNTANSICEQAPTAVTSYLLNKLAGPSSGLKMESNSSAVLTETSSGDANHSVHVTGQTATKTIYTLCPASAGGCNVAGQYRVTWYFNQGGTACGTPTPGQVTFALSWTDNAGAHSAIALPMNDDSSIAVFTSAFKFAATNVTGFASGEFNIWSTGAQPIQVTNTYTACGVGTGTWELTASVEQVQ